MGVLNRDEIDRRLKRGELIKSARRKPDGNFDIEPASYDLVAGTVVWKDPALRDKKGEVRREVYKPGLVPRDQPSITVQPGEMVFVITHEEVLMPDNLCGTVLSRNKLAKEGILALNAGHVDPGYTGPILIRLISLRATPWLLRLGEPIFTIIFHTLDSSPGDKLISHDGLSMDRAGAVVDEMAGNALSNALFDLYAHEMQRGLYEHYSNVLSDLRTELAKDFLKRDDFNRTTWKWFWTNGIAILAFLVLILTLIVRWKSIIDWIKR
jgi:deoxycytidine triphosphate deaminase